jgi:hypothetical protein
VHSTSLAFQLNKTKFLPLGIFKIFNGCNGS